jgi:anti-sigma factor RsiW
MTREREELLTGYIDGALDADEQKQVEEWLASDPSLAKEVARLRSHDRLLRDALMAEIPDETDDETLRRFGIEPLRPAAKVQGSNAANDNVRRWGWPALGAVAAAFGLFLVAEPRHAPLPSQPDAFAQAMEVTPSLQRASLPDGSEVSPVLTFAAADGRFCREFQLRGAKSAASREGIACRDASGAWQTVAVAAPVGAIDKGDKIEVAEGADTSGLDAAYRRLGGSDPLSAAREKQLISGHWKNPH